MLLTHPSRNYIKALNSLDMKQGETYSYIFTEPGEWPYHCSAHYPQGMVANVLVQP